MRVNHTIPYTHTNPLTSAPLPLSLDKQTTHRALAQSRLRTRASYNIYMYVPIYTRAYLLGLPPTARWAGQERPGALNAHTCIFAATCVHRCCRNANPISPPAKCLIEARMRGEGGGSIRDSIREFFITMMRVVCFLGR